MTATKYAILAMLFVAISETGASAQQMEVQYESSEPLPRVTFKGHNTRIHTQGLYVSDQHYLVTGRVESSPKRAVLLRFSRSNLSNCECVDITPTTHPDFDHPGGFDIDANGHFWIPISTSNRSGPSLVSRFVIRPNDALPTRPEYSFKVDDHIGAVCVANDRLMGANWDTEEVYSWSRTGKLLSKTAKKNLLSDSPNWNVAVQDWKSIRGRKNAWVAGGLDRSQSPSVATVQFIDFSAHPRARLVASTQLAQRPEVARPLTNEGIATWCDQLYLLPEDINHGAKILRFKYALRSLESR